MSQNLSEVESLRIGLWVARALDMFDIDQYSLVYPRLPRLHPLLEDC